jgi:hypothetical protein
MIACEMGALCCKSSPCAYWAVDGNAEELAALRAEVEQGHSYLARLLQNTHPQCEPLPNLWGLCTQIDNMMTEIPKLRAAVERLRGALSPLVAVIPAIQADALERAAVHLEDVAQQYKAEPDAALVAETAAYDAAVLLVFKESAAAIRALKETT